MGDIKWKKQPAPDLVLQRLCESRTVLEGGVSTRSVRGDYERWLSVLATSFEDGSSSDAIKNSAIRKAVISKQSMTKTEFEGLYFKARNELRSKSMRYIVCLPVWGRSEYCKGKLKRGEVNIHLEPNKLTKTSINIELSRAKQIEEFKDIFTTTFSDYRRYSNTYCWVTATSASEAHELAHAALSEYVAAICFWDKHGQSWRIYTGLQRPIAEFMLAPHGSVHFSDGRIAYEGFYYHEWHPNKSLPNSRKLEYRKSVLKYTKVLLTAADKSPWPDDARRALRLYNEAFSHHEPQNALLAGWRLLEHLSGPKHEGIDQKLLRVSRMFEAFQEYEIVGHHLRERRNAITHGSPINASDGDTVAHQMKELIEPIFRHFILNPLKFQSLVEFWEFLDIPRDKSKRERQRYMLEKAVDFFKESDPEST